MAVLREPLGRQYLQSRAVCRVVIRGITVLQTLADCIAEEPIARHRRSILKMGWPPTGG